MWGVDGLLVLMRTRRPPDMPVAVPRAALRHVACGVCMCTVSVQRTGTGDRAPKFRRRVLELELIWSIYRWREWQEMFAIMQMESRVLLRSEA